MKRIIGLALPFVALVSLAAACGNDAGDSSANPSPTPTTQAADDAMNGSGRGSGSGGASGGASSDTSMICDADDLVTAVEGGPAEGTLGGMTDDPVATAASNNPVLTTLVSAVEAARLGDTLNAAPELTVFAPTDCAFANFDQATLQAALADPNGLLTQVLGFHVIPERLSPADLASMSELQTFTGKTLQVDVEGDAIELNGGQATVVVPNIQTANATVYLIDAVMVPSA
jgi:uncharacterized surface protein with fasciclin (FAS1) repeats